MILIYVICLILVHTHTFFLFIETPLNILGHLPDLGPPSEILSTCQLLHVSSSCSRSFINSVFLLPSVQRDITARCVLRKVIPSLYSPSAKIQGPIQLAIRCPPGDSPSRPGQQVRCSSVFSLLCHR